jgi:transcriptional regulator with AAA-type ATPase domain
MTLDPTTKTWDTSDFNLTGGDRRRAPQLIRFFRADDPLDETVEFELGANAIWTLGRVDGWPLSAPQGARIWACNDALMSNQHATLTKVSGGWEIADRGSKNGTFVNGIRLGGRAAVADGDIIQAGSSFFIFRDTRKAGRDAMLTGCTPASLPCVPSDYQILPVLPFAPSQLGIHLHGESGVGKDVVARAIHHLSNRKGAFVAMNCAAIPDSLFESELFGYVKGAFSGAVSSQRGQVLAADGGTLFLDEIGELPLPMQAKLLRVLEEKEIVPLGASAPVRVDFRLISATLCDLDAMVAEGRFRRDLYARLGRVFRVPPLREHKEDLGRLIRAILVSWVTQTPQARSVRFKVDAAQAIVRHSWPLNIRELKQCVESALTAAMTTATCENGCVIRVEHLPGSVVAGGEPKVRASSPQRSPATERRTPPTDDEVAAALRATGGSRAEAAKILGLTERTVFRRIVRLRNAGVKV